MGLQEIIVFIIVAFCLTFAGRHIYLYFNNIEKNKLNCSSGCDQCALKNSHCASAASKKKEQKK